MNILIIGGTRFQGRYLVSELLDAGHMVTVFHRGSHAIDPRNRLTDIIGDRNIRADLAHIANCEYDICIDTCAYFPAQIALVAEILKTPHYCLVSSVYVYEDRDSVLSEDAQLLCVPSGPSPEPTPDNYGVLKVMCENEARKLFGNNSLILRPSIIIGIGDHTERLLFWLRLAAVHGKRLDIASREPIVQLVDVRDLARFTAKCAVSQRQGAVNVCGTPIGLSSLLDSIESITNRKLSRATVEAKDLTKLDLHGIPFTENGHFARHKTLHSQTWGFTGRDLRDSLMDIHAAYQHHGFAMQKFQAEESAVLRLFA